MCCPCTSGCGATQWSMVNLPETIPLKKTRLSLPEKPPTLHSSSIRGGSSCTLPPPCWNANWLALLQSLCRQPQLAWVHECGGPIVPRRHCLPGPVALAIFPDPLGNPTLSYRWRLFNWTDTRLGLYACWGVGYFCLLNFWGECCNKYPRRGIYVEAILGVLWRVYLQLPGYNPRFVGRLHCFPRLCCSVRPSNMWVWLSSAPVAFMISDSPTCMLRLGARYSGDVAFGRQLNRNHGAPALPMWLASTAKGLTVEAKQLSIFVPSTLRRHGILPFGVGSREQSHQVSILLRRNKIMCFVDLVSCGCKGSVTECLTRRVEDLDRW